MPNICAIDFGVSNFAAVVCNDGSSMLYKGGAVLSECQWFHKKRAKAVSIINYCMEHHAGTLVLGENKRWKQDCDMGSQNNQNFVSMPTGLLKQMIIYKASDAGIKTIMQEESYTSQADITAMDYIPVYGVDAKNAVFSGKRISRSLYRCFNGMIINADCNGAANIMRKAITDATKTQ